MIVFIYKETLAVSDDSVHLAIKKRVERTRQKKKKRNNNSRKRTNKQTNKQTKKLAFTWLIVSILNREQMGYSTFFEFISDIFI